MKATPDNPVVTPQPKPRRARKVLRWLGRIFVGLLLLWLVRMGCLYQQDPTYVRHLLTYPYRHPITSARWYRPTALVRGRSASPLPLAPASTRRFFQQKLSEAIDYAKGKSSSALLVLYKGEIVLERYWRGQHKDSRTNSMSMAKTLVGLLIGKAIQEGHISSVDAFAATHIPAWRHDERRNIRVRDLLQMHSGLRGDGPRWRASSDISQLYFAGDILAHLWTIPSVQAPGSDFLYKDADSQALGALLELATKTRFADYLSTRLWQPIGAKDAYLWLDRPKGMARTTCCVLATARSWARIGLLLQQEGRWAGKEVVPASWIKQMQTPSPTEPSYGYQLWLSAEAGIRQLDRQEPFQAPRLFYLDGMFRQRVYVMPSRQLVVVRVGERARRWDDARLPNATFQAALAWEEAAGQRAPVPTKPQARKPKASGP